MPDPRKKDRYPGKLGRKVQTDVKPGTEFTLRLVIAGVLILYSHAVLRTNSELTEFESNRNE